MNGYEQLACDGWPTTLMMHVGKTSALQFTLARTNAFRHNTRVRFEWMRVSSIVASLPSTCLQWKLVEVKRPQEEMKLVVVLSLNSSG